MAFRVKRMVEFADTDMAGIVHFANFLQFMEAAEHAYLRACGFSVVTEWEGQRVTFPRVSVTCDFVRPAHFEEELEIEVKVEHIGRTSVRYGFTFLRQDDLIARGTITTVLCRVPEEGRLEPMEVPPAWREKLLAGP
jgi:YbgC/YbaW family acyl-CoA thioester hydrolase